MNVKFWWIFAGLALAACGGPAATGEGTDSGAQCNAATCAGCCDSHGVCQTGVVTSACGANGSTCVACGTGESCAAGACAAPGTDGGPKRVFVTSATYEGNFYQEGNATTGTLGADNLCKSAAAAAGLGGTWRAWVSDGTNNAIDRIADVGPWYLVDGGAKVFNNKANLSTVPLQPINVTENGTVISAGLVWTGTVTGGTIGTGNSCSNWTNVTMTGLMGDVAILSNWTDSSTQNCNVPGSLYCFEQ